MFYFSLSYLPSYSLHKICYNVQGSYNLILYFFIIFLPSPEFKFFEVSNLVYMAKFSTLPRISWNRVINKYLLNHYNLNLFIN